MAVSKALLNIHFIDKLMGINDSRGMHCLRNNSVCLLMELVFILLQSRIVVQKINQLMLWKPIMLVYWYRIYFAPMELS
jgi:hypothetical protein